jgi:hypothetical protein
VEPTDARADEGHPLAAETSTGPSMGETSSVTAALPATESLVETSPADAPETPFVPEDDLTVSPDLPGTSPQVSLQAPISTAPPHATGGSEASLFPWAGHAEARVATRPQPETSRSSAHMPSPNPHYQARPSSPSLKGTASQPPLPGAGSTTPATPPGEAAPAVYPVAEPITYPVTDPATHRSYPPPPGQPDRDAAPASYHNRVPPALPPSGPRHERTGSGLY